MNLPVSVPELHPETPWFFVWLFAALALFLFMGFRWFKEWNERKGKADVQDLKTKLALARKDIKYKEEQVKANQEASMKLKQEMFEQNKRMEEKINILQEKEEEQIRLIIELKEGIAKCKAQNEALEERVRGLESR